MSETSELPMLDWSEALRSADPEDRRRAVAELPHVGADRAVPFVIQALGDDDWRVRKEATTSARALLPAASLLSALVDALSGDDVGRCNAAVDVLGAAGSVATPLLADALHTIDANGRKLAVEALGRTRDRAAVWPLELSLGDPDPNVRQAAAEAIAQLGGVAPDLVERALMPLITDRERLVRLAALQGLSAIGARIPWERLAPLFEDPILRNTALAAAANAGHDRAALVIARALGGRSVRAFETALATFARLGLHEVPEAVRAELVGQGAPLVERLARAAAGEGEEPLPTESRKTALFLLSALGSAEGTRVAIDLLASDALAESARAALARIGEAAVDPLVARLARPADNEGDDDARVLAIGALRDIAERAQVSGMPIGAGTLAALRSAAGYGAEVVGARTGAPSFVGVPAPRVASAAIYALAKVGEAEDLELAERIASEAEGAAAHAADAALATLARAYPDAARRRIARSTDAEKGGRIAALLIGALASEGALGDVAERAHRLLEHDVTSADAADRSAALAAIGHVRGPRALEALRFALTDEEPDVRRTAARALGHWAGETGDAALLEVVLGSGAWRRAARSGLPASSSSGAWGDGARSGLGAASSAEDEGLLAAAVRAAGDAMAAWTTIPEAARGADAIEARTGAQSDLAGPVSVRSVDVSRLGSSVVAVLAALCEAPSTEVATAALDALRRAPITVPGRVEAMARALDHADLDVVKAAVVKLSEGRLPSGAWERLTRALDHDDPDLRLLVVESLAALDPTRARDALVLRAQKERDAEVLDAIDRALAPPTRQNRGFLSS